MSESITHTAIVDDATRLIARADTITPVFGLCMSECLDIARLGGITRYGDQVNPRLLKGLRDGWDHATPDRKQSARLAFVLGWLSHRAADRQMKPVFREFDADGPRGPTDCSIYHDVFIFREVYEDGSRDPYSPSMLEPDLASHPGSGAVDVAAVEGLFRVMWQRMLLVMHTFKPDVANPETWLDNVIGTHQELYVDIRRYAEAYSSPDPAKIDRFLTQPNFYDRTEPLIALARDIQHGRPNDTSVAAALASPARSRYALALQRAFRYLQAASDYFAHRISDEELCARLDIGKPELES